MQFELTKEYLDELRLAIKSNEEGTLLDLITDLHSADIGEILDELEIEEAKVLYKFLDASRASEVLTHMEERTREDFLESLSAKEIAERFIDNLDSDDAADLLIELPQPLKEEVISLIEDKQQAQDI
ncbi:MAG: magnesium transporter, partial [Flavobacteriales bacterium]|nr:magnesium transporter [Flavobacteriales bacterium]